MPAGREELAPLIAIIGCDGSGKSTVRADVVTVAAKYGPAWAAHLGKQAGTVGRGFARLPLIGGWVDRLIARKTDEVHAMRGKRNPGLLIALVLYAFSVRRVRRFRRVLDLRRQGLIIVTDRYPQLELPGAYDGMDLSSTAPGGAIVRWLARRERRSYEWMTGYRPDLVIRLNVDVATACARKPDHRCELLAEKIAVTPLLHFNGAPIVDIDATSPLADVLAQAREAVACVLAARGYTPSDLPGNATGQ